MQNAIHELLPSVIDLRHRLHQIPELAFEEHRTAEVLRAELRRLGIEHVAGVEGAPTATIAILGDPRKPCIALRADMDALPILEQTGLPYASRHEGRMHACGHDGHSAMLVGVAAALKPLAPGLPVCIKLIWQPAEEGRGGAGRLVDAGVLDGRVGPRVTRIFGLHGWPGLPVGMVATRPGPLLAATDAFAIRMTGRGCHGAYPHLGRDPIPALCETILSLQHIVSREIDPTEPALVTVGTLSAGTAVNIIPDLATATGTLRTLDESTRQQAKSALLRRCEAIAAAHGCRAQLEWSEGYPVTSNDPEMADFVAAAARRALGPDHYLPVARPSMGAEDFAFYLQQIPGCFFLVGVQPPDRADYPPLHSDRYDFTDAALPTAMRVMIEIATSSK